MISSHTSVILNPDPSFNKNLKEINYSLNEKKNSFCSVEIRNLNFMIIFELFYNFSMFSLITRTLTFSVLLNFTKPIVLIQMEEAAEGMPLYVLYSERRCFTTPIELIKMEEAAGMPLYALYRERRCTARIERQVCDV